jgi:hypothetical protein
MATEVLADLPTRIRAARDVVNDRKKAYNLALAQWKDLIVEAVDSGMTQTQVAAMAGVAKGRIHAVLVASQPDADDA